MKLIVGLGNPGLKYQKTKHNTGFMAIDYYLKKNGLSFNKEKFEGFWIKTKIKGEDVILLEPQTYMNDSGESVTQLVDFFKIDAHDILVIHDDMDMPVAKIRLRKSGKSGGHNGIKSIIHCLNDSEFNRLKIGIDHPTKETVVSWVLTPFSSEDCTKMEATFATVSQIIDDFIDNKSIEFLMNKYN